MSLAFRHEASRETLLAEFGANQKRIEELQRRQQSLQERIAEMEPPPPAEMPSPPPGGSREAFRDAVVRTRSFTIPELAAELAWTPQRVRKAVEGWIDDGKLREAGRYGKQKRYEYVEPTDPGAGFLLDMQRRPKESPATLARELAQGAGTGRKTLIQQITYKEVRDACQEAMDAGYVLERKGDGHMVLTRGTSRIPVPSTPRNAAGTAKRIRAQMRQKRARQLKRNAIIAGRRTSG
jgi:hypothetical protein